MPLEKGVECIRLGGIEFRNIPIDVGRICELHFHGGPIRWPVDVMAGVPVALENDISCGTPARAHHVGSLMTFHLMAVASSALHKEPVVVDQRSVSPSAPIRRDQHLNVNTGSDIDCIVVNG